MRISRLFYTRIYRIFSKLKFCFFWARRHAIYLSEKVKAFIEVIFIYYIPWISEIVEIITLVRRIIAVAV